MGLLDVVKVVAAPFKAANPIFPAVSAAASLYGALSRNKQQTQAASAQQAFQQEMSNTSYQRAMADMKAAGLNPMLAAKLGGASTPLGAMPNLIDAFTPAAQTYQQAYSAESSASLNRAQEEQVYETVDQIKQQTKNLQSEELRIKETVKLIAAQVQVELEKNSTQQAITKQVVQTVDKLLQETTILKNDVKAIQTLDGIGRQYKEVQPLVDLIKSILMRK